MAMQIREVMTPQLTTLPKSTSNLEAAPNR